jgi:alcohol dehydrogenase, propanol-preferring
MKAAVLETPGTLSARSLHLRDVPKPQVKRGEVLLRVRACGMCRTDLHIVEGDLPPRLPFLIPGHQIVGDVAADATHELPAGTRVGVSWMGGVDGTC